MTDRDNNLGSDAIRNFIMDDDESVNSSNGDNNSLADDDFVDNVSDSEHDSEFENDNTQSDEEFEETLSDEHDSEPAPSWRKMNADEVGYPEYTYNNSSGFKPPQDFDRYEAINYFSLFLTDEIIEQIVIESNRYANAKINNLKPLPKRSMWWSWQDITVVEFKAFVGIILNMGIHPKPDIDDFFSNDWLDYQPFFKDIFSKERFLQIFWNLHLNPPPAGNVVGTMTRSSKVRNTILYLGKKFRDYYVPQSTVSVDESTVGFKGRILFKTYNKDKPQKWGLKIFVLADSSNGYVCALEPYMGSVTANYLIRPDLLMTSRVVLTLVDHLKMSYGNVEGLHIFTDRYYSSIELATALHEQKIHLTGTINRGRKQLPNDVKKKRKLQKGTVNAFSKSDENINIVQWQDKREVLMITTLYGNSTEEVKRIIKSGREEVIMKPSVICRYNESMGGVDLADHYISSYSFTRKTMKWWRKIFFWLLEVVTVNSYILFDSNRNPGNKKVSQRQFRKMLIKQLVRGVKNTRKRGRPSSFDEEDRLDGKLHLLGELQGNSKKECVVCSRREPKGRKRTMYYCETCEQKPGLHPAACFKKYHTQKIYK